MKTPVAIIRSTGFQLECISTFQQHGYTVRTAMPNSMLADIIINHNETISFLFIGENYTNDDVDKRVDDFMKTFQNTFIIMIGNEIQWNLIYSLQLKHKESRFLFATDLSNAIQIILQFGDVMNSDRIEGIQSYFNKKEQACLDEEKIISNLLAIPIQPPIQELQATILLDSMGSLQHIIEADLESLYTKVPLDKSFLDSLYSWFHQERNDYSSMNSLTYNEIQEEC